MSPSLSVEADPIDQPAATDPVERRTWCMLRIRVGGRTVTRIWDRTLQEERSHLYVPGFPMAEWLVQNWWALLNEPLRTEELPRAAALERHLPWIQRHCLRSAEPGLMLPVLYLFHDGRGIRAEWQADEPGSLPHMAGEFVDSGSARLDVPMTVEVLARFVTEILARAASVTDERVEQLSANWRAIQEADVDEVKFCTTLGRMGLDPYDPSQVDESLADFIERSLGDPELPLVRDVTEVADAATVADQWSWVEKTRKTLKLRASKKQPAIPGPPPASSPAQLGSQLARAVRERAGLDASAPLDSVEDVARSGGGVEFHLEDHDHLPGSGIKAIVGWARSRHVLLAGPTPGRMESRRFLAARGLYHALFASERSERLVTDARTWDQQASRAFAAELLAPQAALIERATGSVDRSLIESLAAEFQASIVLIEKQLSNAGLSVVED